KHRLPCVRQRAGREDRQGERAARRGDPDASGGARVLRQRQALRRLFLAGLWEGLRIIWPILSGRLIIMALCGVAIGWVEGWPLSESIYFAFVSGLTIGYGDLVPTQPLSRVLAILVGFAGILLTGLVAAVGVRALERAAKS